MNDYDVLAATYDSTMGAQIEVEWRDGIANLLAQQHILAGEVIDIGCGTGIGARVLQSIGSYQIDGLDQSKKMLMKIPAGLYRDLFAADFLKFEKQREYSLVVCGGDTINHFDPASLPIFFQRSSEILLSDGFLAIDSIVDAAPSRGRFFRVANTITGMHPVDGATELTKQFVMSQKDLPSIAKPFFHEVACSVQSYSLQDIVFVKASMILRRARQGKHS